MSKSFTCFCIFVLQLLPLSCLPTLARLTLVYEKQIRKLPMEEVRRRMKYRYQNQKKRKRANLSKGSSEPSKQSEEEDKKTDEEELASKQCKGKSHLNRCPNPRSVTSGRSVASVASEVENLAISTEDDDVIELLSVGTRHSSEYGDVSSHSISIL